jgi:hypothetical protein
MLMTACTSFLILLMADFHVVQDYKKANLSLFKIRNDEMHSIVFFFLFCLQMYTKLRLREVNLFDFHVVQDLKYLVI